MLGYIADNLITGHSQTVQWSVLADALAAGDVLLDVRTAEEHALNSIPGSLNIPVDELRGRMGEIPSKRIVVHCAVGQRGHTAEAFLRQAGFEVRNLDGGIKTWSHSPAATAHPTK
jgi:rhodanese-related sulfurtransferase